jgi:hypothetical protein
MLGRREQFVVGRPPSRVPAAWMPTRVLVSGPADPVHRAAGNREFGPPSFAVACLG